MHHAHPDEGLSTITQARRATSRHVDASLTASACRAHHAGAATGEGA